MRQTSDQTPEEPVAPEAKWEANRAKVAFAMGFPGRITDWRDAQGKTIEAVVGVSGAVALLFTDGTFALTSDRELDPATVLAALATARPRLESHHADAYVALDRLETRDRDLARRARLEKVLGAIRHNAVEIPELKDAVRRLVASWNDRSSSQQTADDPKDQAPGR